jgi:LasA protease
MFFDYSGKINAMRRSFRLMTLLVCIPLLLALACNFPFARQGSSGPLTGEQLRQTLEAPLATGTLEAAQTAGTTPLQTTLPTTEVTQQAPQPPPEGFYAYQTRSGDTLQGLVGRFGVSAEQISLPAGEPQAGFLQPGQNVSIPNVLDEVTPGGVILPDSEMVYSPSSADFDLAAFVQSAGGYLNTYIEAVDGEELSGTAIIRRVADELSVNPRLLLALLEFRSHGVYGQPTDPQGFDHPIGFYVPGRSGLYQEIMIAATQLNVAYYGWRQGTFTEIKFRGKTKSRRVNPTLNAGSVAVQHLLAMLYDEGEWLEVVYGQGGFAVLYQQMFGDAWARAASVEPLFPAGLTQPALELPFLPGERWSLTAGPHPSWNAGTPRGALDFSPVTGEAVCAVSRAWVTASAPGLVVRSGDNLVALDLDGDGYEQTGWVVVYYHLAEKDLIAAGKQVALDEPLGHPSCEGGRATGKHVHIARKYNGEWLAADGPLPFILSGWIAKADTRNYYGNLVKGDQIISSNSSGSRTSIIVR